MPIRNISTLYISSVHSLQYENKTTATIIVATRSCRITLASISIVLLSFGPTYTRYHSCVVQRTNCNELSAPSIYNRYHIRIRADYIEGNEVNGRMIVRYKNGRVYKIGNPTTKMVISVPRKYWSKVEKLVGKPLLVSIEEIIE